jgi:ribonuclease HI
MEDVISIIFTDGACSGNPGPGGWGAIIAREDGVIEEMGGGEASTTNNRMELSGPLFALKKLPRASRVRLHTDSKYVIEGITGWVFGWKRRGWTTAEGAPVKNRELWESLSEEAARHKIEWVHVPGHVGVPANERCDEIARSFAQGESIDLYIGKAAAYPISLELPENMADLKKDKSAKRKTPSKGVYLSYVGKRLERHQTWAECEARVKGVPGAKFKKCGSIEEENATLSSWGISPPKKS